MNTAYKSNSIGLPWASNNNPSANSFFPPATNTVCPFWNSAAGLFVSSTGLTTNSGEVVGLHAVVHALKGATGVTVSGSGMSLVGVIYGSNADVESQPFTNNGIKAISNPTDPLTQWAGAGAWSNQSDATQKVTLTNTNPFSYFLVATTIAGNAGFGLGLAVSAWNFTTSSWTALASINAQGNGFNQTGSAAGILTTADYVSSGVVYLRYLATGDPTLTLSGIGSPVRIYYGDINPHD